MKYLYCWRCRADMPMLDEDEFAEVSALLSLGIRGIQLERETTGAPLSAIPLSQHFNRALDEYERITGFRETNANAIWHHRLSLYGSPCPACSKPLRTPQARFCPACGWSGFPAT
jgi:hypothetical protein